MTTTTRSQLMASCQALACSLALFLSVPAMARADEPHKFDIAAQPLVSALKVFAEQANMQLLYKHRVVERINGNAVVGQFERRNALEHLLEGTGLEIVFTAEDAATIRPIEKSVPARPTSATPAPPSNDIRLAQAAQNVAVEDEPGASASGPAYVEEIVVTGTNIRGITDTTSPTLTLDKAYIDRSGYATTAQLVNSLPQNYSLAGEGGFAVPGVTGGNLNKGSSINIRGLGEGTTLVLLNGRRLPLGFISSAVDVSLIPLSAIQRVEVVTDGASAIYGSDAVGGVVNFITRKDFDGAESLVRYGVAPDGLSEMRVSQLLGTQWDTGNILGTGEYYHRDALEAADRDFVPATSDNVDLLPKTNAYSFQLAGNQRFSETVEASLDGLASQRKTFTRALRSQNALVDAKSDQLSVTPSVLWRFAPEWTSELTAGYATNRSTSSVTDIFVPAGSDTYTSAKLELWNAGAKVNGPVLSLPGGEARIAVGADWRSETLRYVQAVRPAPPTLEEKLDQHVRSGYVELYAPLVDAAAGTPFLRQLDLSLAGRYDHYTQFGGHFDPKAGLLWSPIERLKVRTSYGTSYRAPKLLDYSLANNLAFAYYGDDPAAPGGSAYTIELYGVDRDNLKPETSKNFSLGAELTAGSRRNLVLAVNYFDIRYRNQISNPPFRQIILADPSSFASLFIRDPSAQNVNDAIATGLLGQGFLAFDENFAPLLNFDPAMVETIVDQRRQNLSVVRTSGIDASVAYDFSMAGGNASAGFNATHVSYRRQRITPGSPEFETVDTYYNPVDWRARTSFAWSRAAVSTALFANYVDRYRDNRTTPAQAIEDWITVDVRVAYELSGVTHADVLSGLSTALAVQNLFDRKPPATAVTDPFRDNGYDPTNSSPIGRLISLELRKRW